MPTPQPPEGFGYEEFADRNPDRDPTKYLQPRIRFGASDPWPPAVSLWRYFPAYQFDERFCSGVVVAPRVALTAAHCMSGLGIPIFNGNVRFQSNDGDGRLRFHLVEGPIAIHPQYVGGSDYDIAVVFIDAGSPFAATPTTLYSRPAPEWRTRHSTDGRFEKARDWGFGIMEDVVTYPPDGFPLAVDLSIASENEVRRAFSTLFGPAGWYTYPNEVALVDWSDIAHGKGLMGGDSGGPMMTQDGDTNHDDEELIGVNDFLVEINETPVFGMAFGARIDIAMPFIEAAVNGHFGRGCASFPIPGCQNPSSASILIQDGSISFKWKKTNTMLPALNKSQGYMACLYGDNGARIYQGAPPPEFRCRGGRPCWRESAITSGTTGVTTYTTVWQNNGGMDGIRKVCIRRSPNLTSEQFTIRPGVHPPIHTATMQVFTSTGCIQANFPTNSETLYPNFRFRGSVK
jgi:hypothetical protein